MSEPSIILEVNRSFKSAVFVTRFLAFIMVVFLFAMILLVWFCAIGDSQLAPHKITQSINGKILNSFWVTNNTYVKYSTESVYTNGQMVYFSVPHTNEYWHIWKCFKK